MPKKPRRDIYQEITDRIIELLDKGTVPWKQPIRRGLGDGWPKNLASNKPYRGLNVFLLATSAMAGGYSSDYWVTFKQARDKGGNVKKGEKSSLVIFWKQANVEDRETGKDKLVPILRHYNVFNADQCEGIEPPDSDHDLPPPEPVETIDAAEALVKGFKGRPVIEHGRGVPRYMPSADKIIIPEPDQFDQSESYYSTLFHELTHATGHSSRLDRQLDTRIAPFGSPDYSKEELVAEMGAAFLNAHAGITPQTIEQSAAYINGWRKKIKGDKKLVVQAGGKAQRAVDHIRGVMYF